MEYLIGYLLLSLITMVLFVEVNKKQLLENYLNFEKNTIESLLMGGITSISLHTF